MSKDSSTVRVSIALCVFNGAKYLPAQLDSLLSQTHRALEIIASDDASSDDSAAILADYAARDARVVVVRNVENQGFSANFANTLSRCTGEFICPSDQDDIWHPEKIARLLAAVDDYDLAYCDSELVDSENRSVGRRLSQDRTMYSGRDPLVFTLTNCASGHAMLFRRRLLERALPMPPQLYYDWWLAIVAACGNGLVYLDEPLVRFRRHQDTVTTLGGVQQQADAGMRAFLRKRLHLLAAMRSLPSYRQAEAAQLERQLARWLDDGNGLPFVLSALRFHKPLLTPLRPKLARIARQSLGYWLALFRKP